MSSVSIDVDIDEFDDRAIIEAAVDRELVEEIVAAAKLDAGQPPTKQDSQQARDMRTYASDAQAELMRRRPGRALELIEAAIAVRVPERVMAAWRALRDGDSGLAICELERFISPGMDPTVPSPKPAPVTAP